MQLELLWLFHLRFLVYWLVLLVCFVEKLVRSFVRQHVFLFLLELFDFVLFELLVLYLVVFFGLFHLVLFVCLVLCLLLLFL